MKKNLFKYVDVVTFLLYNILGIIFPFIFGFYGLVALIIFILILYLLSFIFTPTISNGFKFIAVFFYMLFLIVRLLLWPYKYILLITSLIISAIYIGYTLYKNVYNAKNYILHNLFVLFFFISTCIGLILGNVKNDRTIFSETASSDSSYSTTDKELKDSLVANLKRMNLKLSSLKITTNTNSTKNFNKVELMRLVVYNQNTFLQVKSDTTFNKYFTIENSIASNNLNSPLTNVQIDSLISINNILLNQFK